MVTCGKDKDQCEYRGNHPNMEDKPKIKRLCPTCGKEISECRYQGVH